MAYTIFSKIPQLNQNTGNDNRSFQDDDFLDKFLKIKQIRDQENLKNLELLSPLTVGVKALPYEQEKANALIKKDIENLKSLGFKEDDILGSFRNNSPLMGKYMETIHKRETNPEYQIFKRNLDFVDELKKRDELFGTRPIIDSNGFPVMNPLTNRPYMSSDYIAHANDFGINKLLASQGHPEFSIDNKLIINKKTINDVVSELDKYYTGLGTTTNSTNTLGTGNESLIAQMLESGIDYTTENSNNIQQSKAAFEAIKKSGFDKTSILALKQQMITDRMVNPNLKGKKNYEISDGDAIKYGLDLAEKRRLANVSTSTATRGEYIKTNNNTASENYNTVEVTDLNVNIPYSTDMVSTMDVKGQKSNKILNNYLKYEPNKYFIGNKKDALTEKEWNNMINHYKSLNQEYSSIKNTANDPFKDVYFMGVKDQTYQLFPSKNGVQIKILLSDYLNKNLNREDSNAQLTFNMPVLSSTQGVPEEVSKHILQTNAKIQQSRSQNIKNIYFAGNYLSGGDNIGASDIRIEPIEGDATIHRVPVIEQAQKGKNAKVQIEIGNRKVMVDAYNWSEFLGNSSNKKILIEGTDEKGNTIETTISKNGNLLTTYTGEIVNNSYSDTIYGTAYAYLTDNGAKNINANIRQGDTIKTDSIENIDPHWFGDYREENKNRNIETGTFTLKKDNENGIETYTHRLIVFVPLPNIGVRMISKKVNDKTKISNK